MVQTTGYAIRPGKGWLNLNLRELWRYRELAFFFVWRDLKIRYKHTVIGAAWAIVQPLFTMVVFSVVFGHLAELPSSGIPYPAFTFAALLPWTYFANALTSSTNVVVEQGRLITKVYFPRLLLPIGAVIGGLVDLGVAFVVMIGLLAYFQILPGVAVLTLPLFLLLAIATALAIGLWLSALNAMYRDVRYVLPFLIQFGLYATPVAYSADLVPERFRALYGLNPMAGVIEGFRWALLGTGTPSFLMIGISTAVVIALLIGGMLYFRRMERYFADVI